MRSPSLISSLHGALRGLKGLRVAVLTHAGGDPDSIGSAYVLLRMLNRVYGAAETFFQVPLSPTTHSKALLSNFSLQLFQDISGAEALVALDAGSPEQLGEYMGMLLTLKRVLVIDHHSETARRYPKDVEVYSSDSYQSVSEIIYELAEHVGYPLDEKEAEALFTGIYYDTVRLSVADGETFKKICALVAKGINPSNILARLEFALDWSERIARLKAAARMKLYRFGDWVVALTHVGSFQSSVARALLGLGAHVAIAAGEEKGWLQASLRGLQEFVEKTGVNLGSDLAERIGREMGGFGGGHATAARVECQVKNVEEFFKRCVEILSEKLGLAPELMKT